MNKKKVLVVTSIDATLRHFLEEKDYIIEDELSIDTSALMSRMAAYEGIVTSTKIKFDKAMLDACKQLKWIARMGSGMEQIDLEYANAKGIKCMSSPDGNANAVAEQALAMYLMLEHNILKSNLEIKADIWLREENRGNEIEGKTVGIIGLGNNGYKFAQKLALLGLNVLAYDIAPIQIESPSIKQVNSLNELYEQCSMISFHVPYNADTHHYFNDAFLENMQKPFTLLNLSRGKIVNQESVLKGLESGKIKNAALDVWEIEPISKMNDKMLQTAQALLSFPNFIGTSHIGGYTHEAVYKMSKSLQQKLEKII